MLNLKRILAAAALVAGVGLALPVHAAAKPAPAPATRAVGGIDVPEDEVAMPAVASAAEAVDASGSLAVPELIDVVAGPRSDALAVELGSASGDDGDPFERARDYGRLLILLSVPAAFVGLHLHLTRRAHIVPPSS